MEAGGCTEPPEDNMGPDAFYVEEAQATLAHIQELGLSELADRFLSMNPGPQISVPIPQGGKKRGDFINLNFSKNSGGAKVISNLKSSSSSTVYYIFSINRYFI